ncbi:MAG TPA: PEP-CTERM sorting domain-containing protein [Bryobacteraceae bacterium]|jgi:hypothetical protein
MKHTLLILAVAAASTVANAGVIQSTGVGTYTFTGPGATSGTAVDVTSNPGWLDTSGGANAPAFGTLGADWIGVAANGQGVDGLYTYTYTFTSAGSTPFEFTGNWAVDNCGQILIDGVAATGTGTSIGSVGSCVTQTSNYQSLTAFDAVGSLVAGTTHTVQFQIANVGANPTGFLVDTSAPEPSSVLSVLTGLGLVGAGLRRRRVSKQ